MKPLSPDQRLQQLLHKCQITEPELLCPFKNKVSLLCVNTSCQRPSLHCQAQDCESCLFHQQNGCSATQLKFITGLVKKQTESKKLILRQMIAIETKMMQKLHQNKEQFKNSFGFSSLQEKELHMLELLYSRPAKEITITGKDASVLVSKLQKNKKQFSKKQEECFKFFNSGIEALMIQFINLQKEAIQRFTTSNSIPIQKPKSQNQVAKKAIKELSLFEKLQQLFARIQNKSIQKVCDNKFKVETICQNKNCQKQFHCRSKNCSSCSNLKQKQCFTYNAQDIAQTFRRKFESKKKIFEYFKTMQLKIVKTLKQEESQIQRMLTNDLDRVLMVILGDCYGKNIFDNIDYIRSKNICSKLMEVQKDSLGKQYKIEQCTVQVADYFSNYLSSITAPIKNQWIPADVLLIDSKVVNSTNLAGYKFFKSSHKTAKNYELLYRASEHNFSAKMFHQKCRKIQNIMVVARIKRQNKKEQKQHIIAAYTPQAFQSAEGYTQDKTAKSFLLFLDQRTKCMLKRTKYAVYTNQQFGPCFGGIQGASFDFCIGDESNKYQNSYCHTPNSYVPLEDDQRNFYSPGRFLVTEYQVFRVIQ